MIMNSKPYEFEHRLAESLAELVALPDQPARAEPIRALADEAMRTLSSNLRRVTESRPAEDLVLVVDAAGNIQRANEPACRTLGYALDELRGRPLRCVLAPGQRLEGSQEQRLRAQDGTEIPATIAVSRFAAGEGAEAMTVIVARDSRTGGEMLRQTQKTTREAIEQIERLATAVRRSADGANRRRADIARRLLAGRLEAIGELASGVAHEVNNPISSVLTYSMLMEERLRELSPEVLAQLEGFPQYLESMVGAAQRCARVIESLLTFARQDDRPTLLPVRLADVIRGVFDVRQQLLDRQRIAITCDVDERLVVRGDCGQLQQVVGCLLSNAMRAMPQGGQVDVRVFAGEQGGVVLEVSDTGVGIAEELQERVFEPFFSYPPTARTLGLGLPLVHGIVTRHGGEVTLHSTPGRGTRVRIRLPQGQEVA